MTSISTVPAGRISDSSLSRYMRDIRRFPMLDPQEADMLARRWRDHGDISAADRLVTSHLRLVVKLALGYRGYGLPMAEVVSEGNVGLMQAVKRFDPDMGCRLATYAMWWIRASIRSYVLRSWSLVKIGTTASQKRLFFNLRKAKNQISALQDGDLNPDQLKIIAGRFGTSEREVNDMNRRLAGDTSLNSPVAEHDAVGEWQDWLADDRPDQEEEFAHKEDLEVRRKALGAALGKLNARERHILVARRLSDVPVPLRELGLELGLSCERVRQIEMRAFQKVQRAAQRHVSEPGQQRHLVTAR